MHSPQAQRLFALASDEALSNTAATYLLNLIDTLEEADTKAATTRAHHLEQAHQRIADLADLIRGETAKGEGRDRLVDLAADERIPDPVATRLLEIIDALDQADTRRASAREQSLEQARSLAADIAERLRPTIVQLVGK